MARLVLLARNRDLTNKSAYADPIPLPLAVLYLSMDTSDKPKKASRTAYQTGAHTTHRLRFHLVWIPKYRKRILTGAIALRIEELFREACDVNGWTLHELNVQPDLCTLRREVASCICYCSFNRVSRCRKL